MPKQKQLTIRLDEELYKQVKFKCNKKFGIGITPLIKVFLGAFVSQKGVGFYIGDDDLCNLFNRWLGKKKLQQFRGKSSASVPGPRLQDLYDLNR